MTGFGKAIASIGVCGVAVFAMREFSAVVGLVLGPFLLIAGLVVIWYAQEVN